MPTNRFACLWIRQVHFCASPLIHLNLHIKSQGSERDDTGTSSSQARGGVLFFLTRKILHERRKRVNDTIMRIRVSSFYSPCVWVWCARSQLNHQQKRDFLKQMREYVCVARIYTHTHKKSYEMLYYARLNAAALLKLLNVQNETMAVSDIPMRLCWSW